ncbi:unnamed protein product [Cochlearia groenlandica]
MEGNNGLSKKESSSHASASTHMTTETKTEQVPSKILEMMIKDKGYNPMLTISDKGISNTDMDKKQGKLSLPRNQVMGTSFLTEEEKQTLDAKPVSGIQVVFIDPDKDKHNLELRKWKTGLVLTKGWKNVLCRYINFKSGQKYSLWTYRAEKGILCFALVSKVDEPVAANTEAANTVAANTEAANTEAADIVAANIEAAINKAFSNNDSFEATEDVVSYYN